MDHVQGFNLNISVLASDPQRLQTEEVETGARSPPAEDRLGLRWLIDSRPRL